MACSCSFRCCCLLLPVVLAVWCQLALLTWPPGGLRHIYPQDRDFKGASCPPPDAGFDPKQLITKGYTVVRNVMTETEMRDVDALRLTKTFTGRTVKDSKGGVWDLEHPELKFLEERLMTIVYDIQNATDIFLGTRFFGVNTDGSTQACSEAKDTIHLSGQLFHTNSSEESSAMLPWHGDLELGIMNPKASQHLSVYVFLDKPFPGSAGLSVLDKEAVRERAPELADWTDGRASFDFYELSELETTNPLLWDAIKPADEKPNKNYTFVADDLHEQHGIYHGSFDELECTPELNPGDAIIFRGDVIHRTQPHSVKPSWRTSLNLRLQPQPQWNIPHLYSGGLLKADTIAHFPALYLRPLCCSLESKFMLGERLYGKPNWNQLYRRFVGPALGAGVLANAQYKKALFRTRMLLGKMSGEKLFPWRVQV